MLSIIIPAYNEEENIRNTTQVIHDIVTQNKIESELLFIDDGSSDKTWDIICEVSQEYSFVRGIRFSRNFGKEGAIFAGLRACKGDCAVMMDCDLQHPPELMPQMYRLWEQGFEVVEAVKASRGKESLIYKMFAKTFYRILRSSSQINLDRASDYKLLDRKVVDALNQLPERLTFFRALSSWVGFRTTQVEFNVLPRAAGTTKWSFRKLYKFAINSITSFTNLPMQIVTFLGVLFAVFSLVLGIQTLINFFMGQAVAGFSTVILLLLIIGSVLMLGIGILGYYVSKIYEEIKFRPRYIVSEEIGGKTDTLEKKEN
jgi:dolichol-phosphate mannosyltransferase